ncbi:right-handed parallel beta-helix repeat-containing protein [Phenylobacterium sp.]|uniref:right-handed parallel beta-helix repeat-containing protein n=1 Tax=Phenylobacterium sp. TaxID=1871053 RepID=UPI0025D35351|nr:right-handed parallel beta-helix repeat-containing protein [Phenylobacterium sp.]
MSNQPIDSTAGLLAALKVAQGGDVLLLAPGVYSGLNLNHMSYGQGITITSADPAHPAVITDFNLVNVAGMTFSHVEFATLDHTGDSDGGDKFWAFKVGRSDDIHFYDVKVHGSLDGDSTNDAEGLQVRDSSNISVVGCEFQQLERGLAIGQTYNVVVTDNNAHDLRSDGFDFAEVSNVVLTGNTFRNFSPNAIDHPDAIQFWTSGTKTPSHDIMISGNVIFRGDGAYTQGIFLRDQIGTLPYQRVTIADNLIVGTGYNGIRIQGATDLTLRGNQLVSFAGDNKTWLLIQGADIVNAIGNQGAQIGFDKSTHVTQTGTVITTAVDDHGAAAVETWIAAHQLSGSQLDALAPIRVVAPEPQALLDPMTMPGGFSFMGMGGSDFLLA